MALTPRLDLRQSQSLVMTPQLQQAIKLLQFSNLELMEYVEAELEQNPLLERQDNEPDEAGGEALDTYEADESEGDGLEAIDFEKPGADVEDIGSDLDIDVDNEWNTKGEDEFVTAPAGVEDSAFGDWGQGGGSGFEGGLAPDLEETLSGRTSLRDHLSTQMAMTFSDPVDLIIGERLIDNLDGSGYLTVSLEETAQYLGCTMERVEHVLSDMQNFDPSGIFARSLTECLSLQLKERNRLDPAMQALLENLELLARRELDKLVEICGVDAEDVTDMVAEIRELDPKPAEAFDDIVSQPVVPDVIMRPQPGGGWMVELNSATLPRVLVNNTYFARISKEAGSKADKRYINECHQSANWLVKSLHQRATTILKVASELVRQQDLFFSKGVQYLRPLVLRDIADVIEMHESTVSRVTSNKFMATPRGVFELKYFFNAAIGSSSGGESHAAESVRHRIKELIDDELATKILSDDKIVSILKAEGIDIARRTVAKYREALGIASSVQRRREKRSAF